MRYVVTGGAGFIGSHLVKHLLEAGHEVVVLDDLSTGSRENLKEFQGKVRFVEQSVADFKACIRTFQGADYVLHQAALGSVPRSIAYPHQTHAVNATGSLNVLRAAQEAGVRRVVYAGSSSAYGDTEILPKAEEMAPRPRSPYAVAKLTGEHYARAFSASYGLSTVVLRYFNVFGPRQDPHSQYAAVIPRFVQAALSGRPPQIYGDGFQTRDFTYIDNVVEANMLACDAPDEISGHSINIGAGHQTSILALWGMIADAAKAHTDPEHLPPRQGDVRHSLAALEKAERLLGYRPRIDVAEGVRRTVEWFRAHAA